MLDALTAMDCTTQQALRTVFALPRFENPEHTIGGAAVFRLAGIYMNLSLRCHAPPGAAFS